MCRDISSPRSEQTVMATMTLGVMSPLDCTTAGGGPGCAVPLLVHLQASVSETCRRARAIQGTLPAPSAAPARRLL